MNQVTSKVHFVTRIKYLIYFYVLTGPYRTTFAYCVSSVSNTETPASALMVPNGYIQALSYANTVTDSGNSRLYAFTALTSNRNSWQPPTRIAFDRIAFINYFIISRRFVFRKIEAAVFKLLWLLLMILIDILLLLTDITSSVPTRAVL